jgi:cell shape-determining protein MreC
MKMSYELKSSIHRGGISWTIKIVIFIVFVLVILYFLAPAFLSSIFTTMVRPLWRIGAENKQSQIQLPDSAKDAIISQLTKENSELKEIMGRTVSDDVLIAYILKKPPYTAYDSFILDVGSRDNVAIGDKVYVYGNILIGEIEEILVSTSKVRLYSSFGEKYEILIGDKNIEAVATGRGGGSFETVLPRDIKVSEGDTIIIPDISNTVFGIVGKVVADPARAFSTIIFSQPINIYEQKFVQIYEKTNSN